MYTELISKKRTQISNKKISLKSKRCSEGNGKQSTHACKYGLHYSEHPTLSYITIPK